MSEETTEQKNNRAETGYSTQAIRQIRRILLEWGTLHFQPYEWRSVEQQWHGLIAEVLLQRTKANSAASVYRRFVMEFATPADLGNASIEEIEAIIYPLGLKWRAPLLKQLGQRLALLNDVPPNTLGALLDLPAVGPYAAAAYLSFHSGKRGTIIDANVVRWLCRMVDKPMNGETRRERWLIELADALTPHRDSRAYNYAVLDFSMLICSARPKCEECPLGAKYCAYRRKQLPLKQKA